METISATYRVTTPLFCGGADPQKPAELRLPSFKGVLRFWWRALAWSRFEGKLGEIKQAENELFGSAAKGQGRVVMRFENPTKPQALPPKELLQDPNTGRIVGSGARYLGYGLMSRFCLKAPFEFTVILMMKGLRHDAAHLLLDALKVVGLLGGMGARSRKGYGSLNLVKLDHAGWVAPGSIEQLQDAARQALGKELGKSSFPQYTAFSTSSRFMAIAAQSGQSPLQLLDLVGKEMLRYRSWGRQGKILTGVNSEKIFRDDHDLMKQRPEQRQTHPRRIAFGLPHNYGKNTRDQVTPGSSGLDRRASPLFIHIHDCAGVPAALVTFLPSRFLPRRDNKPPTVNVGGKEVDLATDDKLWKPIHDYLDRLLDSRSRKESFARVLEFSP